jgi:ketosteroid isomerase-like protein
MAEDDDILHVNAAYYRAFATADFTAMSRIWAKEQVSCVHPGWPVLIGRKAVLDSWKGILGNPGSERIEFHEATAIVAGDEGRVLCIEVLGETAFAASNWFRRIDGAWRMIHHHASPIALTPESGEEEEEERPRRLN